MTTSKYRFHLIATVVFLWFAVNDARAETLPADSLTQTENEYAQEFFPHIYPGRHILTRPELPDSADVARAARKHFWRGAAETVGLNLALWSYDRYIQHGEFAYISWETIKENFRHGFEWDDDYLGTNMFAHPYNGSQYFNAGRSNGYGFYGSLLFAAGGSAMWELFMEKEYPSTNDIIATPIGGAALGEVLYRGSDLVLDDRSTGWERFGREAAAFVLDPMRGLTRIFSGDAWRTRETSGRVFGIPPISVEASAGYNLLSIHNNQNTNLSGGALEIAVEYGDRYAISTSRPYDYFSFLLELNFMKTQPLLNRVEIQGRLFSQRLIDSRDWDLTIGMYQHFDYFDSDTIRNRPVVDNSFAPCDVPYKFGTPASAGVGAMTRFIPPGRSWQIEGQLHFNGVFLGGILTDYYRDYHRNYNWGSGFGVKASVSWALANHRIIIDAANQFYQIYTWGGYNQNNMTEEGLEDVMGDASRSWFNHLECQVNYRLWQRLYLSVGVDYYLRQTNYSDHTVSGDFYSTHTPIIRSNQFGFHAMLTYKI